MVSALGKNGQIINIVPSQNLVMICMGKNPDNSLVPITYNNDIWTYLNQILCNQTCTFTPPITGSSPVCSSSTQNYSVPAIAGSTYVWTVTGGTIQSGQGTTQITVLWNKGVAGTVNVVQTVP
jgi:hypothetical protein